MGISPRKKMNYYRLFKHIHESPSITYFELAARTGLSRNAVSKYVKEMYAQTIITGPFIEVHPASNYRKYVYVMDFDDPFTVFHELKGSPHVVYCAVTSGHWNTLVITDRLSDFSNFEGFKTMVYQGKRGYSHTPTIQYTTWDENFKRINEHLNHVMLPPPEDTSLVLSPSVPWAPDEWKLYYAFSHNIRQKITPLLQKINVSYETYVKWRKSLPDYCTTHTGFYPDGYKNYESYCFLFFTDYTHSLPTLFSHLPTTPFTIEVDTHVLVFCSLSSPKAIRTLFCSIYDMKTTLLIKKSCHTVVLSHFHQ
jgi:DNA-binding Lrp family transcriptional regulator